MNALLLVLLLPFFTALLCLALVQQPRMVRIIGTLGAAGQLGVALFIMRAASAGDLLVLHVGGWQAPFGISIQVDMLSALMLLVTAVIALAVMVYSWGNIDAPLVRKHFYALSHLLLMGVNGAFVAGDLFNLYVWFEVMLLASFVLISFEGGHAQLEGGVKYLVINLLASLMFLTGIGLIYGKLGTLNMADLGLRLAESPDATLVTSSSMLLLTAFAIKSALFPFFFWLPASYHTPRLAISAFFAGLLTKVGLYALLRFTTLMFHSQFDAVQPILLTLAGLTMVSGVLGAAAQYDIRKILSFHIISQIGYILLGIAVGTPAALAAAIFYTFHHIVVKSNLFLITGLIESRCGSSQLRAIGGLAKTAPLLALLFFVPAFSLGGIPPLSGFWAKFALIRATLDAGHGVLVGAALLVSVLTLYSMTKIWAEAFWKSAPSGMTVGPAAPGSMRAPVIALALLTLAISLWSSPLFDWSIRAAEQLLQPEAYTRILFQGESA